jgi:hypothetical protein
MSLYFQKEAIAECKNDENTVADLQQLNTTLRDLLSMWFSVGFLRLERVTWQSPCDLLQKVRSIICLDGCWHAPLLPLYLYSFLHARAVLNERLE